MQNVSFVTFLIAITYTLYRSTIRRQGPFTFYHVSDSLNVCEIDYSEPLGHC